MYVLSKRNGGKRNFRACKCKGSHIAHKICIEEFIKRNNNRCSVCNTKYNLRYDIPTDYQIFKIIIKEYANNFTKNLSAFLKMIRSVCKSALYGFIESSKFFVLYGVPIIFRLILYFGIFYSNYRLNYYLLSNYFEDVMLIRILSIGSLCINYSIFDWFANIGRNISKKKKAIIRNRSTKFEILPYLEE